MKTEDIDRQIGMPDIDKEWEKFATENIDRPQISKSPRIIRTQWLSRAAIIALVCTIGFVALAGSLYIYNNEKSNLQEDESITGVQESKEGKVVAKEVEPTIQVAEATPQEFLNEERQEFVFDNTEMQTIAACLQQYYGVEPVFEHEETKHIRLYVTLSKKKSLSEVIELLNHLEVVQLRHDGERLIIE